LAQARCFFERALELDPTNIEALVGKANIDLSTATTFMSCLAALSARRRSSTMKVVAVDRSMFALPTNASDVGRIELYARSKKQRACAKFST